MQIIIDARALRMYPVGKPGFTGGTEEYVRRIASGLAVIGHTVDLITPDLERMGQRADRLFYWPDTHFPTKADVCVLAHSLEFARDYDCDHYVGMSNGIDAYMGPEGTWASAIDFWPVFSQVHAKLLCQRNPTIEPAACVVTGLGVDLNDYPLAPTKVPGRLFYSNDPARGLKHALDVFDELVKLMPKATLHIGYDFERQFAARQWESNAQAQSLWECRERIQGTPGVVNLGELTREQVIAEQLACHVHVMPSEPPNVGSQIHGILQMECAAAGCPLVLSDVEAFPEVFGDAAEILPVPGTWFPDEGRVTPLYWAEVIADLMADRLGTWGRASRESRELAEKNTWDAVVGKWDTMLATLASKEVVTA